MLLRRRRVATPSPGWRRSPGFTRKDDETSQADLVRQLRLLGVEEADVLLVHTSFRAVHPVEGGPVGLIEALRSAIGPTGTLVMPSWPGDDDQPFDPRTTPAAANLGVADPLLFLHLPRKDAWIVIWREAVSANDSRLEFSERLPASGTCMR